jgi:hypothetical protein
MEGEDIEEGLDAGEALDELLPPRLPHCHVPPLHLSQRHAPLYLRLCLSPRAFVRELPGCAHQGGAGSECRLGGDCEQEEQEKEKEQQEEGEDMEEAEMEEEEEEETE